MLESLTGITAAAPSSYVTSRLLETRVMTVMISQLPSNGITLPISVLDKIRRTAKETFAQIRPYLDAIVQAMPSSICRLEDDGEGLLRWLICLSACKKALLGVYPSYHYNDFKGIALAACSVDGNGEIVPVALASPAIEEAEIGIG
jgi:hypothetical protein